MKVKEATLREVHWRLKWNAGEQANTRLRQALGELSSHFAQLDAGNNGKFLWSKPGNDWIPLSTAEPMQQEELRRMWQELRHSVHEKLAQAPDLAENILSIPNEDYLFFAPLPDGGLQLLVTGWGFMNYRRSMGSVITERREKVQLQDVCIHLMRDGAPLGGETFQLVTPNGLNALRTNEDGSLLLPSKVRVGESFHLRHPDTGKEDSFEVVEGQTDYVWDVTEHTSLSVRATLDDKPLADVPLSVSYHGHDYPLRLDASGAAVLSEVPYHDGASCTVSMGDERQERALELHGENLFEFALHTKLQEPPAPPEVTEEPDGEEILPPAPPAVETFRLKVLDEQGRPFPGMPVLLSQGGRQIPAQLDAEGQAEFNRPDFMEGQPIDVQLQNPARQLPHVSFALEPGESDYVLQERVDRPNPWEDVLMQILLVVVCAFFLTIIGYFAIHFFSFIP
ncbi:MAG: hypothetical protein IJ692_04115 [Alloprevotella sp.]|nr:hypothetical protein [Alloprevotella sp.]MBR1652557.1 hypothetical protein [Alloprevotella sp.]